MLLHFLIMNLTFYIAAKLCGVKGRTVAGGRVWLSKLEVLSLAFFAFGIVVFRACLKYQDFDVMETCLPTVRF